MLLVRLMFEVMFCCSDFWLVSMWVMIRVSVKLMMRVIKSLISVKLVC